MRDFEIFMVIDRYFDILRDIKRYWEILIDSHKKWEILRDIERYWDIDVYKTDTNETWKKIFSKLCNWFAPLHPCSASRNF